MGKKINKYMMATKAEHMLGDISRDNPSLCYICEEENDNYIGSWVTGFGFIGVMFPKETTRDLTEEEIKYWNKGGIQIGSGPIIPLKVD